MSLHLTMQVQLLMLITFYVLQTTISLIALGRAVCSLARAAYICNSSGHCRLLRHSHNPPWRPGSGAVLVAPGAMPPAAPPVEAAEAMPWAAGVERQEQAGDSLQWLWKVSLYW